MGLISGCWYILRYYLIPPALVVVFTSAIQYISAFGGRTCLTYGEHCDRLLGDRYSWTVLGLYVAWVIFWLKIPSKKFTGPESPEGEKPEYQDNGFQFYVATIAMFFVMRWFYPKISWHLLAIIPDFFAALSAFAFVFCVWLLIKAKFSGKPSKYNFIYDFYRGCELHPKVLGCDAKQFAVSRMGMMLWQMIVLIAFLQSMFKVPDIATFIMQTVYIAKFFWWETGYFTTLDVTYDRAGYYLCWGGMAWIPTHFSLNMMLQAHYPPKMDNMTAMILTVVCLLAIYVQFCIDNQKEVFVHWRQQLSKDKAKPYNVWGKPVQYIKAMYVNDKGEIRHSALLTSGYWGLARHANYTCELLCALLWCLPATVEHRPPIGPGYKILPLLYFYFILGLMLHRITRDETKCKAKYGKSWDEYCKKVPYRFIPYVF